MQPATLVLLTGIVLVAGCGPRTTPAAPPPPSNTTTTVTAVPPAAPSCEGSDHRLYGSTCCESSPGDDRFPGMIYLSCTGPQVGQPCSKKGDCDIGCSCDDQRQPLNNNNGPQGPADGTRGVTGVCTGQMQIGVWMCTIDETGGVSHMIVD